MNKTFNFVAIICVLSLQLVWGQHTKTISADSMTICAKEISDSLQISIITDNPKVQMSFLMQGTHVSLCDSNMKVIAVIDFPSAKMVREKIRHHPNEVKAMHNQKGHEVRPDLLPLILALNDTCCLASNSSGEIISCLHLISINKEEGSMSFEVRLPSLNILHSKDSLYIDVKSSPTAFNTEFNGRKFSKENRMPQGGMGQAPTNTQDTSRNIHIVKKICIED